MSLIVAMPTDHLGVVDRQLEELGLYKAPTLDAASRSVKASYDTGRLTSNQFATNGHSWAFMPPVALPSVAACPKFILGARFSNLPLADSSTQLMRIHLNGSATPDIFFTMPILALPVTTGFVEIEIDRTQANLIWTCYFDGVQVSTGVFSSGIRNIVATTGCTITCGLAAKGYTGTTAPLKLSSRDQYLVLADTVKPNARLGAVTISAVPVTVSAVSGFDKTAAEANTILSQSMAAVAGTGPLTRPSGQMKTIDPTAEVTFTIQSAVPVGRQIAVGIFIGAQRTGDRASGSSLTRTLDGVPASIPMVDFPVKAVDRLMYTDCLQPRLSMAAGDARPLSDVVHKLTLAEI